jgi:DNA-binding HxlR family transcriptional regulator
METKITSGWNVYNELCPTRLVLHRIADKWTVMIVGRLATGTMRFGEIKREIGGISQKVLTQTLRGLERDGLVSRKVHPEIPPRVEYSLTPLGRTLVGVLEQIRTWAESNIEAVLAAQRTFDAGRHAPDSSAAVKIVRLASQRRR